ncbi:MAG: sulfur carrier protein ThiS [Desulfobacterales bacterium]
MIITINGDTREFNSPLTVTELLKALDLESQLVLVERNLQIVERDDMAETQVTDGDAFEILKVVGGGS